MTTLLCILDGVGIAEESAGNALKLANTPNFDLLTTNYPNAQLLTHGKHVGLPDDQMGNSEVGHMTIGSGRVIKQTFPKINQSMENEDLYLQPEYKSFIKNSENSQNIHLIGLISEGGVHSHMDHTIKIAKKLNDIGKNIYIHVITDGRDVAPDSAKQILKKLNSQITGLANVKIADIIGRFYAMDRDNRDERIKLAFDLYTKNSPASAKSLNEIFDDNYANDIFDEQAPAVKILENSHIQAKDSIVLTNFRSDRVRQITQSLISCELNLNIATFTQYHEKFDKDVTVFYPPEDINDTIGQIVAENNMSQLRISETEKYAHVTFFMNGGVESEFKNEDRILINSPKVETYDLQPEMSSVELTASLVESINSKKYDLIICNVPNGDMVGHTGKVDAAIKAMEAVDVLLGEVMNALKANDSQMIVIADHGNCEQMLNADGSVLTKHSKNPVPICYFGTNQLQLKDGTLADVAPTLLKLMNLKKPKKMTGLELF